MAEGMSSGYDLITRLDENYMYLLQFVDGPSKDLTKDQQNLIKKWLVKLSTDVESQSIFTKLLRNSYLVELIHQIQKRNLNPPFNTKPPQGELQQLNFETSFLADQSSHPEWLDKLMREEENKVHVGAKHFETYLSTKIFDGGRGACAYLAVSAQNEGEKAAWVKIRQNQHKDEIIERMFNKELGKYMKQNESE